MDKVFCQSCKEEFIKKTPRQKYCCRKCFKKSYRKKIKVYDKPIFICPKCGKKTKLDFYPITSKTKWSVFVCDCGYSPYYRKIL